MSTRDRRWRSRWPELWAAWCASWCRCGGSGVIVERGEVIPRSKLSPAEQAELMVNGGCAYERIERACTRHGAAQTQPQEECA